MARGTTRIVANGKFTLPSVVEMSPPARNPKKDPRDPSAPVSTSTELNARHAPHQLKVTATRKEVHIVSRKSIREGWKSGYETEERL